MTRLVHGGHVLNSASMTLERADVRIAEERISAVGPALTAPAATQRLDVTGCLVLPGLINAHTHAHNNLLKGMGDNWTLEDQLNHSPALHGGRTAKDQYLSANQNMFEAMRFAALVGKVRFPHTPERWIGAQAAWDLATRGGARVLGMVDDLGAVAPRSQS